MIRSELTAATGLLNIGATYTSTVHVRPYHYLLSPLSVSFALSSRKALHQALDANHWDIMDALVQRGGADINGTISAANEGVTPLILAANVIHPDCLRRLKNVVERYGAEVNQQVPSLGGITALHSAVSGSTHIESNPDISLEAVKYLLSKGADPTLVADIMFCDRHQTPRECMEDFRFMGRRGLVPGIREALLEAEAIFEAQRKLCPKRG